MPRSGSGSFADELIDGLTRALPSGTLTHVRTVAAQLSQTAPWPDWVDEDL